MVWHVYVSVPYPVSIRGSLEFSFIFPEYHRDFVKKKSKYFKLLQVDEVCSENDEVNERAEGWDRSE